MGRILYFDCLSGISGDMTIGALLDLGADQEQFREQLSGLAVDGYQLEIVKKRFNGISGTDFDVVLANDSGHQKHRNLNDINQLIEASRIGSETKNSVNRFSIVSLRRKPLFMGGLSRRSTFTRWVLSIL